MQIIRQSVLQLENTDADGRLFSYDDVWKWGTREHGRYWFKNCWRPWMRSKVIKASFWAMIQMNSSESKTDSREHQTLYPEKDAPVIRKSAGWTTVEASPSPPPWLCTAWAPRVPRRGQHTPGCRSELMRCTWSNLIKATFPQLYT